MQANATNVLKAPARAHVEKKLSGKWPSRKLQRSLQQGMRLAIRTCPAKDFKQRDWLGGSRAQNPAASVGNNSPIVDRREPALLRLCTWTSNKSRIEQVYRGRSAARGNSTHRKSDVKGVQLRSKYAVPRIYFLRAEENGN